MMFGVLVLATSVWVAGAFGLATKDVDLAPSYSLTVSAKVGLNAYSTTVDGTKRTYHLYVPKSARNAGPRPLVIALHGGGGRALAFAKRAELKKLADRYGALVALPQGLSGSGGRGGSWNTASVPPVGYADKADVADLAFIDVMVTQISREAPVSPQEIFALGLSKGGMMAYHIACERPGLLRGIAVVSGTLASGRCRNAGQVNVLHIHGSADQNVPVNGGRGSYTNPNANWTAVDTALDRLFDTSSCSARPITQKVAQDTTCEISQCAGDREKELCIVAEGGHGWPGAEPAKWQIKRNQYISPYFDATDHIGMFFFGE